MKVYLDVVIFTNFFFDFLIISSTSILLKRNVTLIRNIGASLIGEFSLITLFISVDNIFLILLKFLLSSIMILVAFGRKNFLSNTFYFYIITIILGGTSYLIKGGDTYKTNLILMFIVGPIIVYLYIKEMREYHIKLTSMHDVIIIDGHNTIKLNGYLDTGNKLVCPLTKLPVIMVSKDLPIKSNKFYYVPYNVVNSSSILKCVKVDKVLIDNKIIKVLLGLCDKEIFSKEVTCILNDSLREMI